MPKVSDIPSAAGTDSAESAPELPRPPQIQIPPLTVPEPRLHRWLSFEDETSIDYLAVIGGISLLLVGGFWFAFTQLLGKTLRVVPWTPSVSTPAPARVGAVTPNVQRVAAVHRRRDTDPSLGTVHQPLAAAPATTAANDRAPIPVEETAAPRTSPENVAVRFIDPRLLEVQWDSLGDGYVYRLYWAVTPQLSDPQPVLDHPTQTTYLTWTPDDELRDFWLAVKGIDSEGHETGFSRPIHIQLLR